MVRPALKIVEGPSFYRDDVELWSGESARDSHSLHHVISYPESFRPEIAAYFINRYTSRGDTVLDPFCGRGTTALEANLLGRGAFASDKDPIAVRMTEAKLAPADLAEITLRLQQINFKRPVRLDHFDELFHDFYDPDTFREIVQLRAALLEGERDRCVFTSRTARTDRFIQLLALSLLHGHSAGFFSVYTFPQIALSPAEQARLNQRRAQIPQYRAVVPRILRRGALVLRDGLPSVLQKAQVLNAVAQSDARNLDYVASNSVDLIVTGPPLPTVGARPSDFWLRYWFLGLTPGEESPSLSAFESLSAWRQFMGEFFEEARRVLRSGRRMVLDLREIPVDGQLLALDEVLVSFLRQKFSKQWELECVLYPRDSSEQPRRAIRTQLDPQDEPQDSSGEGAGDTEGRGERAGSGKSSHAVPRREQRLLVLKRR